MRVEIPRIDTEQVRGWLPDSRREWLMVLAGIVAALLVIGLAMQTRNNNDNQEPPGPTPLATPAQPGITTPWIPDTVRRWEGIINEMAQKYNLDPNLVAIIMTLESGGYSRAQSGADAQGLMQVTPGTARDIARMYLAEPREDYDMFDPRTNVEFGAAYIAHLRNQFGDPEQGPSWDVTVELIGAGYNAGPGNAGRLYRGEGLPTAESVSYSRDAMNMWRERNSESSPTFERWLERGGFRLINRARAE